MYDPKTHRVCISQDVVWLLQMFYQKQKNIQEMETDPVTVGSWSSNPQGVLRFIEVGEGISNEIAQGSDTPTDQYDEGSIENEAEDQPVNDNTGRNTTAPTGVAVTKNSSGSVKHQHD